MEKRDKLVKKNRNNPDLVPLQHKIKYGVSKLNGFLGYMSSALRYIEEHGGQVEKTQRAAHNKCKDLMQFIEKKETEEKDIQKNRRNQSLNIKDMQIELMSTSILNKTEGARNNEESLVDRKLKEWACELDTFV